MSQKKLAFVFLLGIVLCVTGVAMAAAVKIELLPWEFSVAPEPDARGQAVLNYAKGKDKTIGQFNCWGLTPETDYDVYLFIDGSWENIGTFTTNKNGAGHLHAYGDGDHRGSLPIAINNAALNATVLMSP
jgi:hypothetical protein